MLVDVEQEIKAQEGHDELDAQSREKEENKISDGTGDTWYEQIEGTIGRKLKEKKNIGNNRERKQEATNSRRNKNKQREVELRRNFDIKQAFLTVQVDHDREGG